MVAVKGRKIPMSKLLEPPPPGPSSVQGRRVRWLGPVSWKKVGRTLAQPPKDLPHSPWILPLAPAFGWVLTCNSSVCHSVPLSSSSFFYTFPNSTQLPQLLRAFSLSKTIYISGPKCYPARARCKTSARPHVLGITKCIQ